LYKDYAAALNVTMRLKFYRLNIWILVFWITLLLLCSSAKGLRPTTDADASEYHVTNLPGIMMNELSFAQYAGHISANSSTDAHLFFWLMESIKDDSDQLVFWFNGGPGCSSMDGVFLEGGPYRMEGPLNLTTNPYAWNQYAHVVFVDQPVGTGLSYASSSKEYVQTQEQLSEQFYHFLMKFFKIFPSMLSKRVYLAGESYAGVYIPYIASKILENNKKHQEATISKHHGDQVTVHVQLEGIMIGNGWIDPLTQYRSYIDYPYRMGLIDTADKEKMEQQYKTCQTAYEESGRIISHDQCERLAIDLTDYYKNKHRKCFNVYRVDLNSDSCGATWPLPHTRYMKHYLNRLEVQQALHLKVRKKFVQCSDLVSRTLETKEIASVTLLPDLAKHLDIVLYYGDLDSVCNYLGGESMLHNLTWNGHMGFQNVSTQPWYLDHQPVGVIQTSRRMTYAVIYNASHMTPYDAPAPSLDLFRRFLSLSEEEEDPLLKDAMVTDTYQQSNQRVIDLDTNVYALIG
jgi:carboxypeptidase D